jgi:hypothetical protein
MRNRKINESTSNRTNNIKQVNQEQYIKSNGWINKSINIKYNQVTEIGNFEGGKLFGYLPAEYNEKSWHDALDRGFAPRSKGSNGVKYLEHKLLELKNCTRDERLYTKTVHKNTQGDYLAIFDHETNHKGIEREVRDTKKILIDDSCASDFYLADYSDTHDSQDSTDTAILGVEDNYEIYS